MRVKEELRSHFLNAYGGVAALWAENFVARWSQRVAGMFYRLRPLHL